MIWFLVALTLPVLAGYRWIARWDGKAPRGFTAFLLHLSLAIGLGFGVSSSAYFLWLLIIGAPGKTYHVCESAILIAAALVAVIYRRRMAGSGLDWRHHNVAVAVELPPQHIHMDNAIHEASKGSETSISMRQWHRVLQFSMAACLIFSVLAAIGIYRSDPLGEWDAWGIWNLRARGIFLAGDQWRTAFSPIYYHTDYPLLVPCGNARLWSYLGVECPWSPWLAGCLFSLATVGALTAGVARLRSSSQGLLAGMTLLGIVSFLRHGAWQYADVQVAFYMFSAVLPLAVYDAARYSIPPEGGTTNGRGLLALSGVMAGMAAWTKNEGLMFLVALAIARCIVAWRPGRSKTFL
jgi:hypothetical protein